DRPVDRHAQACYASRVPSVAPHDVNNLVLGIVRVNPPRLSRSDAVEIELAPVGRGERDPRHLVRRELGEIADPDLHDSRSARARSDTGCVTSMWIPLAPPSRPLRLTPPRFPPLPLPAPPAP